MPYADYAFYRDTYLGNQITEQDFPRLVTRAGAYLDEVTGGQAAEHADNESIKLAACAVAEAVQVNEQGGELASQSVGSWSKTYQTSGKGPGRRMYEAACLYLWNSGLIAGWC